MQARAQEQGTNITGKGRYDEEFFSLLKGHEGRLAATTEGSSYAPSGLVIIGALTQGSASLTLG
jgi:hypothetical protein